MDPKITPMANLAEIMSDTSEPSRGYEDGQVADSSGEAITLGEDMGPGMQF